MRKLVFLAILVLVIGGCQQAAIRQQIAEQQALLQQGKSELEELLRQLRQAKEQAPLRPRLAGKIPVDLRDITFAMMANGDKPTPEEREAILQSAEISLSYQKKIIDLARRYNTSAILISLTDASFTQSNVAALELYQGQLTYGEYLTKMKQLMSAFQSD